MKLTDGYDDLLGVSFEDVLEAKASGDRERLNEASISRVYQHVKKADVQSLGILTAWRAANTKKKNLALNKALGADIRAAGLGFFKMRGHWKECQDPDYDYKDCPPAFLKDTAEPSYGVVGIDKKTILRLAKKYEQDAVVFMGPESKGKVVLLFKNGSQQPIGKFSPGHVAQAYSQIRGNVFVFEGFEYLPQTHAESMISKSLVEAARPKHGKCAKCAPEGGAILDRTEPEEMKYVPSWTCRNCGHHNPRKTRQSAKHKRMASAMAKLKADK